jgi:hypothetical protein
MSDTQIHGGIKYVYIENIEKISILEEKLQRKNLFKSALLPENFNI